MRRDSGVWLQWLAVLVLTVLIAPFSSIASIEPMAYGQAKVKDRITRAIEANQVTVMKGSIHPLAKAQFDTGRLSSSTALEGMTLHFKPTDAEQAALKQLAVDLQTPGSPKFHRWLTPAQYGDQFGLSKSDVAKVKAWLESQGFTVSHVADSRNAFTFSGTVGQAETAFRTELHSFNVNGEKHFANATEISIPASIAENVTGVMGLNDFKPKAKAKFEKRIKPQYTNQSSNGEFNALSPEDFATIYDVKPLYNAGIDGTGVTIAISGQTDLMLANEATFRTLTGLPASTVQVVQVPGANDPGISVNDLPEADLDVEWTGAVAKNATIIFVKSTNAFISLLYPLENQIVPTGQTAAITVPIISNSYGNCEVFVDSTTSTTLETAFQQAGVQGQTILAATGDTGAADCDSGLDSNGKPTAAVDGLEVDYPASSQYVTGVGGTEYSGDVGNLNTYWSTTNDSVAGSALSYIPETAWDDTPTLSSVGSNGFSAGGGGASSCIHNTVSSDGKTVTCNSGFSKPTWQTGVAGIPNDGVRDIPDLALNASPEHDPYLFCTEVFSNSAVDQGASCTGGDFISSARIFSAVGGTSAAAPSFAGILALIEQKTGTVYGNLNYPLYSLASDPTIYAAAFHDVTTGSNKVPCASGTFDCPAGTTSIGYNAGVGYDQATGLGTVDANALANAFATSLFTGTQANTQTLLTSSPNAVGAGGSVTLTATVVQAVDLGVAPTGSVQFYVNGTTTKLGSAVTLSASGTAALTTTDLPTGSDTVTAVYSGDTNYGASTSAAVSVAVGIGSYTLKTSASATVSPGSPATATITVTGADAFAGTVALTCAVTPSPSTDTPSCSLSPPSVVLTASATTGTSTVTFTSVAAHAKKSTAVAKREGGLGWFTASGGAALASLFLFGIPARKRRLPMLFGLTLFAFLAAGIGCGSGGGGSSSGPKDPGTAAGNYTVTVTGTSGSLTQTTTFTVTVN